MIRAIILDIDGVILGHLEGRNFPLPSENVQLHLQSLSKQIPISLCTVKAYFAVEPIIQACGLENSYHITDAGATLIKSSTKEISTISIELDQAKKLIEELGKNEIYVEWYSGNEYYTLPHRNTLIRDSRTRLYNREAVISPTVTSDSISKIIAFPTNEIQEATVRNISQSFTKYTSMHWGINPARIPVEYPFFTDPTATKRSGAERIAELNGIPLSETLAVGDSTNDWTFMELCGYKATLGNGSSELKSLVTVEKSNSFLTRSNVDQDGILEILKHFNL
ncbi:HAD family phosphatase [bacterium]|nr:HAD family phosphatase [bacterium]